MEARPAFRPDIEGLRGAAILLVVLFHAEVRAFAGGFVGVDVFFVLSGFFITGMLAREYVRSGTIDLNAFYGSRAKRLLPALLLVLLVTLVAVMWLYAPIDRAYIAERGRAVALYSANIDLANTQVDYFSSGENPLLHTWSLAVEEQFYLVWPLLFLGVAAVYGRWNITDDADDTEKDRKRLLMAVTVAGVASLILSLWLTKAAQPWAFFGMPARIWEFAAGGALALALREGTADPSPSARDDIGSARDDRAVVLQALGILAIGIAVATYVRATPYPGWAALLPALGTCALIVGGARAPNSAISRALSAPWLRWLGRMSYAWYLWHWPLVGIGAAIDPMIGVQGRLVWSGVALIFAWLTNKYIEAPSRDGEGIFGTVPTRWVAFGALGASVVVAVLAHRVMLRAKQQAATPVQRVFAAAREDRMSHNCWATTVEDVRGPCAFGDLTAPASRTLALLGDSHAEHWLGGLDRFGKERGWKIVAMVKGGCPVADLPRFTNPRLKRYYHECTRYREAMVRRIIAMRPAAVILSSWDHYIPVGGKGFDWQVTSAEWRNGLRQTYTRFARAGVKTVAIRGTPRTWFDVPACLSRRAARLPFATNCTYDRAEAMSHTAIGAQNAAARGLPIRFVDMNDVICSTARCATMRNGLVVFTDDNHLTASFTRSVGPVLGARIEAALR